MSEWFVGIHIATVVLSHTLKVSSCDNELDSFLMMLFHENIEQRLNDRLWNVITLHCYLVDQF